MLGVSRARVKGVACGVIGLENVWIVDVNYLLNGAWWVGVACRGGMGKLAVA